VLLLSERELVTRYARRLRPDGLVVGTAGNVSVRAGELVAVTPSGLDYDELTPRLVCVTGLDGRAVEGELEPSRELPLHLAVYRGTDAGAVVHTHSPYATAAGSVLDELPAIHYLAADLGGAVRVARYATPGTDELGRDVVEALAGRTAALLSSHGALTVGASLEQAYARSLLLEWLAALFHRARGLGEPRVLPDDELERLRRLVEGYGQEVP
jgi:L-fuculose-phosphate aldolase